MRESSNLKRTILVIFVIFIIVLIFQRQDVLAVQNIQVSSNKNYIKKEEEIKVEIGVEDISVASLTLQIYFDMTKLEYINKTENSNFSNNRVIYTWTDNDNETDSKIVQTFTFKAIQDGSANVVVTGEFYDRSGNKVDIGDGSFQIEIGEKQEKTISENENENNSENYEEISSDNTNLKIMRLNQEGISPDFQKSIKEYYFLADSFINQLDVTAVPENKSATVKISGNTNLKQGLNTIKIEVQSADKTKKTEYTIYVTKTDNKELANSNLENLAVKEGMIFPSFDANITHYDMEVANTITKLEILAIPQNIKAKVTIAGNEEIKEGYNVITINVTAEDGVTNKKYVINVHRRNGQEEVQAKEEQQVQAEQIASILENTTAEDIEEKHELNKSNFIIISVIVSIVIIVCFILIIVFYKKKIK